MRASQKASIVEAIMLGLCIFLLCMVSAYAQVDSGDPKHANTPWACDKVNVTVLPLLHDTILSKGISDLNKRTDLEITLGLVSTQRTWTIDGCDIEVGYINTSLYIASELQRNQCAFDHVMEHEQEHLAIYRRHLATLKERAEQRLPQAKTLGELHAALNFLTLSARPDQAQLDSPEEYAKSVTACRGKLKAIMLDYLNGR